MPETPVISIRWDIESVSSPPPGRRSMTAGTTADTHLANIVGDRFEVEKEFRAVSPQRRGSEPLPPLDVTIPAEPGQVYLMAVRQEQSGALSFHAPKATAPRRGAEPAVPGTVTFEVSFAEDVDESARRSIISKAIKAVVLKVAGKFADLAVPWVGSEVEKFLWEKKGLSEGWLSVTPEGLRSGKLPAADFSTIQSEHDRCLLFLHGTFSNTAGGFGSLADTNSTSGQNFFAALAADYGNRIFAFNHFTVSKTPEQNAREFLAALPKTATFDVITHSRGGLVVRNLVERQAALGPEAARFKIGKVVEVAAPNIGTPLATADRFESLVSWWSNILELFPENPYSMTLDYIGEALVFIARHVVDALPGLEAMDMDGSQIETLNSSTGLNSGAFSAIASNYQPKGSLLARMLDLGVDGIFGMANDLVVPTTGAWKTDDRPSWIPNSQIGCFGVNITPTKSTDGVIHTNYFAQPETVEFLINVLSGKPTGLQAVNVDATLPFFLRRSLSAAGPSQPRVPEVAPAPISGERSSQGFLSTIADEADNILQLFLISPDDHIPDEAKKVAAGQTAILLATYRNARVVETIYLRHAAKDAVEGAAKKGPEAATVEGAGKKGAGQVREDYHWNEIIDTNERIKDYVDGKNSSLPGEEELLELGVNLFNAMLPAGVRRLYDVARIERARATDRRRLDVVITSMINWVADKPWEFAYDPDRQSFLATETVNFTRNVLTAVPAEEFSPHPATPLRILVVVAQPMGLGLLSAPEEEQVVRRGFRDLEDLGLVTVEYMLRASIDDLHERLRNPNIDILHFIGHGVYDNDQKEGFLVFERPDGSIQKISAESLRQVLCGRGLRLVFLNACETGMVGRADMPFDFNRGVAPKLVAGGIPTLVANQYKVLDVSATEFAKHFYRWLALGSTVGDAAREARVAVNYSVAGETIDWAVPVVYARNPGRMIYTEEEKAKITKTFVSAAQASRNAPCVGFKGTKVGLWDVNQVLPQLSDFALRLNSLQADFCFRPVEVSAPIGTWRLDEKAGGYINADEVSRKLQDHVASLGMNRLICLTTFKLADDVDKNLALWNNDPEKRVTIISSALILAQIKDPRSSLNHFFANMLVSTLCEQLDHKDGAEDCPNFTPTEFEQVDQEKRAQGLISRMQFCPACLRKAKSQSQVESLNRILTAW